MSMSREEAERQEFAKWWGMVRPLENRSIYAGAAARAVGEAAWLARALDRSLAKPGEGPQLKTDTQMIQQLCDGAVRLFPEIEARVREIAREEAERRISAFSLSVPIEHVKGMVKDLEEKMLTITGGLHNAIDRVESRLDSGSGYDGTESLGVGEFVRVDRSKMPEAHPCADAMVGGLGVGDKGGGADDAAFQEILHEAVIEKGAAQNKPRLVTCCSCGESFSVINAHVCGSQRRKAEGITNPPAPAPSRAPGNGETAEDIMDKDFVYAKIASLQALPIWLKGPTWDDARASFAEQFVSALAAVRAAEMKRALEKAIGICTGTDSVLEAETRLRALLAGGQEVEG